MNYVEILAAVLVPSILRYVTNSRQAQIKQDAATVLTQIQADYAAYQAGETGVGNADANTAFGTGTGGTYDIGDITVTIVATGSVPTDDNSVNITISNDGSDDANLDGEITYLSYIHNGHNAVWDAGTWSVDQTS